ncbi:hypothetical protein [Chromohalobacter israelensis]|uniref:hypothetical protein n=1 Tax=Chromohalobacter israelensis TaxID=141390 RepID=UPI000FFEC831|nr:hypothetical protein [Chromohalobacter salexigens]
MFRNIVREITAGVREHNMKRLKKAVAIIRDESLTCAKCEALSVPIKGTHNKYRCLECNRQFANTKHDVGSMLSRNDCAEFYDKAVSHLKGEASVEADSNKDDDVISSIARF